MSNDKQERIVCAAIKFFVESISGDDDPYSEVLLCLNYDDEYAFEKRFELSGTGYYVASEEKRGFITNKNRFVDPKEAMGIAIGAGQILYLNELLDAYINDVIGSRVISPQARMILNAWEHQRKMAECRELKSEDLY